MSEIPKLISQNNDQLTLNQSELKKLPNYKDVVSKLEALTPGESNNLIRNINTQLAKLSQKVLSEQGKLQKLGSLVGIDTGKQERQDKLKVIADNYSNELQGIFNNFNVNNHFAGTELIEKISGLGNNPNLTKIANFTKEQEGKTTPTARLGNITEYGRGVTSRTEKAIEEATK